MDQKRHFLKPFSAIAYNSETFIIWLLFTIVAGLIGPIITFLMAICFPDYHLCDMFENNITSGALYTFSVAVIANAIGSVMMNMWSPKGKYKQYKLLYIAVALFPMFFSGVSYSVLMSLPDQKNISWVPQVIILVMAIILAVYSYCLQYMDRNPEIFKEFEDYLAGEIERMDDTNGGNPKEYNGSKL